MGLKKKGIVFTIMAIILLGVLAGIIAPEYLDSREQSQYSINNRIYSMDGFIENLKTDTSYALYASGFRGLVTILDDIQADGTYTSNVEQEITELILHGTKDGDAKTFMVNNTVQNWTTKMAFYAARIGIDLNITFTNITVVQNDPWYVTVGSTVTYSLNDMKGLASWNFSEQINADIPIEGFDDPLYIVGTGNKVIRKINRSAYDGIFVNGSSTANLQKHIQNGSYVAFQGAPNYLMRLEGDFSASPMGIESLVDKDLIGTVQPILDKSNADYVYFSGNDPAKFTFSNMPANFKLDNTTVNISHIARYNLSGLVN